MDVKFKIGKVVGTSWWIWSRNFGSILVLTAMIYLPVIAAILPRVAPAPECITLHHSAARRRP
jgi:hypothetical protein